MDVVSTPPVEPATTARIAARAELWPALVTFTLVLALLEGLGAFENLISVGPTTYAAAMSSLLLVTILATPRSLVRAVRYPRPVVAFIAWLVLSYAWSSYRGGFVKATWRDLITLIAVLVLGQLLPVDRFFRVVLNAGYIAIALIFVALAAAPSRAYSAADGLRGGFIHKSPMGAALVLTVAAALCFERRPGVRRVVTVVVVICLVLGKTTTGIASILLVLALYLVLVRYKALRTVLGRSFGALMAGSLVIFGALYFALTNALVALSGKDLTFSKRTLIWQGVVDAVRLRPITGYGWTVWTALWREPASGVIASAGFAVAETHNAALELLLRLGLVGLVLYVVVLVKVTRSGLRLAALGDRAGIFAVLVIGVVLIWGFSESLAMSAVWVGLLGVLAVARPTSGIEGCERPRGRLLAPRPARVH